MASDSPLLPRRQGALPTADDCSVKPLHYNWKYWLGTLLGFVVSIRLRWLILAMTIATIVGLAAYDFRDRLQPYHYKLTEQVSAVCTALPKLGIERRYQNIRDCPWQFRIGDKQKFSGLLYFFCEDSAEFVLGVKNDVRKEENWPILAESVQIRADDKATRSFDQISREQFNVCGGPPFAITVEGWRLHYTERREFRHRQDVVLIDRYIRAAPYE
jgi:hypothetical protein